MGLELKTVHVLGPYLAGMAGPGLRVLTLGKQDLYFDYAMLIEFLRKYDIPHRTISDDQITRTDSFATVAHEDWHAFHRNLHQRSFFNVLGFDPAGVLSLDVDDYEGADIIHDLNNPVPPELVGTFDLVLDLGTIEHVFDIRRAFLNIKHLLRPNGTVLHIAPANLNNHGFINLCPTVFADFYAANGFEKTYLRYMATPKDPARKEYRLIEPDALGELGEVPGHVLGVFGIFRKTAEVPDAVPKQSLYVGLHEAWDHQDRSMSPRDAPERRDRSGKSPLRFLARLINRPQNKLPGTLVRL